MEFESYDQFVLTLNSAERAELKEILELIEEIKKSKQIQVSFAPCFFFLLSFKIKGILIDNPNANCHLLLRYFHDFTSHSYFLETVNFWTIKGKAFFIGTTNHREAERHNYQICFWFRSSNSNSKTIKYTEKLLDIH